MNAFEKSKQLGLTGTDEEIVPKIKAITEHSIILSDLIYTLNMQRMLRKTYDASGNETWTGTLCNLKAALIALGQTAFVEQYDLWFAHITSDRQTRWQTDVPSFAVAFAQMEQMFGDQENMPSRASFEAVAALGGGRPWGTLTVEQFTEQRLAAEAAQAARAELESVADAAYQQFVVRYNSAKAGIADGSITTSEQVNSVIAGV